MTPVSSGATAGDGVARGDRFNTRPRPAGEGHTLLGNEALRAGLAARTRRAARRYRLAPVSLGGVVPGVDLDKALRLSDALEDDAIARKFELRN